MDYIQVSAKTVEDAVLEAAMKLATTREQSVLTHQHSPHLPFQTDGR